MIVPGIETKITMKNVILGVRIQKGYMTGQDLPDTIIVSRGNVGIEPNS